MQWNEKFKFIIQTKKQREGQRQKIRQGEDKTKGQGQNEDKDTARIQSREGLSQRQRQVAKINNKDK